MHSKFAKPVKIGSIAVTEMTEGKAQLMTAQTAVNYLVQCLEVAELRRESAALVWTLRLNFSNKQT